MKRLCMEFNRNVTIWDEGGAIISWGHSGARAEPTSPEPTRTGFG